MSDRNKHRKNSSSDFLRYKRGEMTGEERNSYERELQKDSFAEEASEGFELLSPKESQLDLKDLHKRIGTRTSMRKGIVYYRIAASVAVLMVISTIFILVERNGSEEHFAESVKISEPLEISKGEPVMQQIAENIQNKVTGGIAQKTGEGTVTRKVAAAIEQKTVADDYKETAKKDLIDSFTEVSVKPVEIYLAEERMAAPASISKTKSSSLLLVRGKVISSDDNLPVPGANIYLKGTTTGVVTDASGNFSISLPDEDKRTLVANFIGMESKEFEAKTDKPLQVILAPSVSSLNEVVVVGYSLKRDEDIKTGYIAPQPVNGRSGFDKYIEQNINRPDTTTSGQRVVVVINFTVLFDGNVDSIKIIRSPGKQFSDEAIRLIKSGPKWRPAEENGKVVEDEVRMRIVFK